MEDIKNKSTKDAENKVNDTNEIDESKVDLTDEVDESKDVDTDKDIEDINSIKSKLTEITEDIENKTDDNNVDDDTNNNIDNNIDDTDNVIDNEDDIDDINEDIIDDKDVEDIKDIIDIEDVKNIKNNKDEDSDNSKKQSTLIKAYDFEKSRKFSTNNVKFLESLSIEFCKTSNLQLHHELKHENLKLKFSNSQQTSLSNFIEDTDYNSVLLDFTMGRANNLIVKIDKIPALTFVECLLGGDGSIHNKEREVTDIDSAILKYITEKLLNNLSLDTPTKAQASVENISLNVAKFKTPVSSSENLFISNMDMILKDEKVGEIAICVPTVSVEGIMNDLVSRMSGALETVNLNKDELLENEHKVINALCENKVAFDIVAELGKTTITVGELLSLDTDDVLILNRKIDEPIDVLVGGTLAYKAQPGLVGLNKALVIESLAEKGEITNDGEENN